MYKNISKISFSRLLKLELPVLARGVIEIVDKHDPETLKIKELFDKLVEQKTQIKKLEVAYGPHPLTEELNDLRNMRLAFAVGIVSQMRTIKNGKVEGMQAALKIAQPVAHRYLHKISRHNNKVVLEKITQFFDSIEEDAALESAFDTLNLTTYLDEMQSVHSTLMEQFGMKRSSISERPDVKTATLVKSITTALKNIFADIELSQIKNQDLDYTPLIDELNAEIAEFTLLISKRASYNKKKADGVIDDNEVVNDDESGEEIETTETDTRMYPMNEEVELMENLDDMDKKRTVAASSGQARPPIVSTKA